MVKYCFWMTALPESAACLYDQNTSERHAGCLASLASYDRVLQRLLTQGDMGKFIAALECTDRYCQVAIGIARSLDLDIFGAMQQQFPELQCLELVGGCRSLFIFGSICPTFAIPLSPSQLWSSAGQIPVGKT